MKKNISFLSLKILIALFLFILLIIYILFITHTKNTQIKIILKKYLEQKDTHLQFANFLIGLRQKHYFEHKQIQKAIELFKKAVQTKNPKEMERLRKKIYYLLLPTYKAFRKEGNRGIQFNTKNGRCFLRMHIPNKFGDDLSSIRPSMTYLKKHLTPWVGFEIGRTLSGFRYMIPVVYKKHYLGNVEIILFTKYFILLLKSLNPSERFVLIMKKDILKKKLSPESWKNYINSPIKGWVFEKGIIPKGEGLFLLYDLSKDRKFLQKIKRERKDVYLFKKGDKYYKIAILPFKEANNKVTAILLCIKRDNLIPIIVSHIYYRDLPIGFLIIAIIYGLMMFAYIMYQKSERERVFLKSLMDSMDAGCYLASCDKGILWANTTALKLLGYTEEEIKGLHPYYELNTDVKKNKTSVMDCPIFQIISKGKVFRGDIKLIKKDGTSFWSYHVVRPVLKEKKLIGCMTVFVDIGERKKIENKLYQASIRDYLTGLYNRRYAMEFLKREKALADRGKFIFCVAILDLDNFKKVNDTYGHDMGDKVLSEIGKVLLKSVREYDLVARWGGEEFLIVFRNASLEEAYKISERIRKAVEKTSIDGIKITISIGLSCYKKGDLDSLLKKADDALYKAKKMGKNRVCIDIS